MKISFLWFKITLENARILKNWTNYGYFLKTQVRGIHLNIARGEEDWMFADETVHFYANEARKCSIKFKVAAHHGKLDQVLDQAPVPTALVNLTFPVHKIQVSVS